MVELLPSQDVLEFSALSFLDECDREGTLQVFARRYRQHRRPVREVGERLERMLNPAIDSDGTIRSYDPDMFRKVLCLGQIAGLSILSVTRPDVQINASYQYALSYHPLDQSSGSSTISMRDMIMAAQSSIDLEYTRHGKKIAGDGTMRTIGKLASHPDLFPSNEGDFGDYTFEYQGAFEDAAGIALTLMSKVIAQKGDTAEGDANDNDWDMALAKLIQDT